MLAALAAFLAGCATPPPQPATIPGARVPEIPVDLLKPGGAGPFPAGVMLHDCSGLGPRSSGAPRRWARELVDKGYVVAIPDSFSTRGFPAGVCTERSPDRVKVGPFRRVADAYDTLDYVRSLPYVGASRVAVMGGSHGGSSTLASIALSPRDAPALAERKRHGFTAAIALYPSCDIGSPRWNSEYKAAAPLLILSGELDDWTPAAPCVQLVEAATRAGSAATIKVYPGAHHSFDSAGPVRFVAERNNAHAPGGRGATTGGNPEAWADSRQQVAGFLERHLRH
jgi:dienelactone hydrolase